MTRLSLAVGVAAALVLAAAPAMAQKSGGVVLGAGAGAGLAPMVPSQSALAGAAFAGPPPTRTPVPVASVNPARARQATNQAMVAKVRGDAGFLAGFHQGQPLAASRQAPPPQEEAFPGFLFIDASTTLNNFQSVLNLEFLEQPGAEAPVPDEAPGPGATAQETTAQETTGQEAARPPARGAGRGRVEINNVDGIVAVESVINAAVGNGNVAQQVISGRR